MRFSSIVLAAAAAVAIAATNGTAQAAVWNGSEWDVLPTNGSAVVIQGNLAWNTSWATNLSSLDIQSGTVTLASGSSLGLTIAGNATIASGAAINLTGTSYYNNQGDGSAAHGGNSSTQAAYDSVFHPTMGGQSTSRWDGTAYGGGVVSLNVGGTLTLDGTISANGTAASGNPQVHSAGGSVYLNAGSVAGAGTITASGDSGDHALWGQLPGGAGGRVAVITAGNSMASWTIKANGSDNDNSPSGGAAGTVYTQTAADAANGGTVTVSHTVSYGHYSWDPAALPTNNYTPLGMEDLSKTKWLVTDYGQTVLSRNTSVNTFTLQGGNAKLDLAGKTLTLTSFTDKDGAAFTTPGTYSSNNGSFDGVNFGGGEIIISSVPEPALVGLIGLGLMVLPMRRRRQA